MSNSPNAAILPMQLVGPFLAPDPDSPDSLIAASLLDVAPPSLLRLVGPPPVQTSGITTINQGFLLDLNTSMRMGYGGLLSAALSAQGYVRVQDITVTLQAPGGLGPGQPNNLGGIIKTEYWGYGVRVLITGFGVQAGGLLNLGAFAASCETGASTSSYSLEFLGLPPSLQAPLAALFTQTMGKFNMAGTGVVGLMQQMMNDIMADPEKQSQIKPVLLYVDVDLTKVPVAANDVCSYCWTMEQIARLIPMSTAVVNEPPIVTPFAPTGTCINDNQVQGYYNALGANPQVSQASAFEGCAYWFYNVS